MPNDGTVGLVRDLFLIIASGVFIIVVVAGAVVGYQLYRRLTQVIVTAEEISGAVKTGVEQVSSDAREISRALRASVQQVSDNVREVSSTVRASVEQVSSDVRHFSNTVLNRGASPVGNVVSLMELINRVIEMIRQFRSRPSGDEDVTT